VSDDGYVLAVKPSARKRSAAAGEWVNLEGPTRRFASKALAREWARSCRGPGAVVWVQDAVPWHERDVDGYLVGGERGISERGKDGHQAALSE
jgi:hypothetical protein